MLILDHLPALHWAVAGAGLGLLTLALLYLANCRLGISTGFENICALVSRQPYFRRAALQGHGRWRLYFLAGLLAGGVMSACLAGPWHPTWDLGRFDRVIGWGTMGKLAWMLVGGLFIGFGTRLAGGCTSGHGIFGIANFEKASWTATIAFMASGLITTNVVYHLVWGG